MYSVQVEPSFRATEPSKFGVSEAFAFIGVPKSAIESLRDELEGSILSHSEANQETLQIDTRLNPLAHPGENLQPFEVGRRKIEISLQKSFRNPEGFLEFLEKESRIPRAGL